MKLKLPAKLQHLKTRQVSTYAGLFTVPTYVVRIEQYDKNCFGWQVRFNKPYTFVVDEGAKNAASVKTSLATAIEFLEHIYVQDYRRHQLRTTVAARKTSKLPVGISEVGGREHHFSVTIPVFGGKPALERLYIPVKCTKAQHKELLAKAVEMRKAAEEKYKEDKRKAIALA